LKAKNWIGGLSRQSDGVAELRSIDDMIDEIRIGVEDPDELFGVVLELYESICGQLGSEVTIENVIDRLRLNAISPQSSNSLLHISTISYVVLMT
jgi:hypothetical protein